MVTVVVIAIVIALLFDFLNGMNDAANSIATIVSTKVLTPTMAVLWGAFWDFSAYFFFGITVANTMGKGIVDPGVVNEYVILSALIGAVIWVWVCTHFGMPISVSHALIGGLIGPVLFGIGPEFLIGSGIAKIALFIVLSPLIGMVLGFLMMCLTMLVFKKQHPMKVEGIFKKMQLFSSAIFSLGHGGNDAQKTMGIIAILLFSVSQAHPDKFFSTLNGNNVIDVPQLYISEQKFLGNSFRLGKKSGFYFVSGIMYGAQLGVMGNNWGMGTKEGILWRPNDNLAILVWNQYFQSVSVYAPVLFHTSDGDTAAILMPATPEVFSFGVQASFVAGEFIIGIGVSVAPEPFQKRHHSEFRYR